MNNQLALACFSIQVFRGKLMPGRDFRGRRL